MGQDLWDKARVPEEVQDLAEEEDVWEEVVQGQVSEATVCVQTVVLG